MVEEYEVYLYARLCCRWRDVKLRAFDNAKHRTYVDLKVREIIFVIHANL